MKSSTCFCRLVSAIETPCDHCGRTKSENQAKSGRSRRQSLIRVAKRRCLASPRCALTPHQIRRRAARGQSHRLLGSDLRQREATHPDRTRCATREAAQVFGRRGTLKELCALL